MQSRRAVERLVREHDNIAQVLVVLDSELASLALAEEADDTLAMTALEYLADFVDGFHHAKEDLALEAASARVAVPAELVAELQRQHARIRESGEALRADLECALMDEPVSRREIAAAGFTYSRELRRNLELEEQHLLPLLATALDDADWQRIEAQAGGRADPLFGVTIHQCYEDLFHEIERLAGVEDAAT